ncbi:hypothetical protein HDG35_005364 [Paraburkholderia sp. JPY681]|nr:hypothetical protein [Paraburkholderia atlantica]
MPRADEQTRLDLKIAEISRRRIISDQARQLRGTLGIVVAGGVTQLDENLIVSGKRGESGGMSGHRRARHDERRGGEGKADRARRPVTSCGHRCSYLVLVQKIEPKLRPQFGEAKLRKRLDPARNSALCEPDGCLQQARGGVQPAYKESRALDHHAT